MLEKKLSKSIVVFIVFSLLILVKIEEVMFIFFRLQWDTGKLLAR